MKICIFGAGAIGGYLGVQLAQAGAEVSLVARGPHLAAMRKNGVRLLNGDEEIVAHPSCTRRSRRTRGRRTTSSSPEGASSQRAVESMQPLLGHDTAIVTAVNGVPYWYFYKHGGELRGRTLESVDPGGRQWRELRPERAIGCIVYPGDRGRRARRDPARLRRQVSGLASRPASGRSASSGSPRLFDGGRAAGRRCSTTSATRSGSSCGATSPSTRSAR